MIRLVRIHRMQWTQCRNGRKTAIRQLDVSHTPSSQPEPSQAPSWTCFFQHPTAQKPVLHAIK